jgi:hypothetical protein
MSRPLFIEFNTGKKYGKHSQTNDRKKEFCAKKVAIFVGFDNMVPVPEFKSRKKTRTEKATVSLETVGLIRAKIPHGEY